MYWLPDGTKQPTRVPFDDRQTPNTEFDPSDVDGNVIINNWNEMQKIGMIRPLVDSVWGDNTNPSDDDAVNSNRAKWVTEACEFAATLAGPDGSPLDESTGRAAAFTDTCVDALSKGTSGVANPDDKNVKADLAAATAVGAALNQLRATGRPSLDFEAKALATGIPALDQKPAGVFADWKDVIRVYMTDETQWRWRGGTDEKLGSESCGFKIEDECKQYYYSNNDLQPGKKGKSLVQMISDLPDGQKTCEQTLRGLHCQETPSANASVWSPGMSHQHICRRAYGFGADGKAPKSTMDSHWLDTLFVSGKDFTEREKMYTGPAYVNAFKRDRNENDRLEGVLKCEAAIGPGAYQQAPIAGGHSALLAERSASFLSNEPIGNIETGDVNQYGAGDEKIVWTPRPSPEIWAQQVVHTCALITNRVADKKGLNLTDKAIDTALAACYRKVAHSYADKVGDFEDHSDQTELIEKLVETGVGIAFMAMPELGLVVEADPIMVKVTEELMQQAFGKVAGQTVAGEDKSVKLSDLGGWFAEDLASPVLETLL